MRGRNVLLGLAGVGGFFALSLGSFDLLGNDGPTPTPVMASPRALRGPVQGGLDPAPRGLTSPVADSADTERQRVTLRDLVAAVESPDVRPSAGVVGEPEIAEPDWKLLTVTTDGPRLEQRYDDGSALYEGTQIESVDGDWVRHGVWNAWHENGQPWERGAYADGLEDGPWDWWYENGNPMSSGVFRDGQRVGPWSWWYPDGQLMMTGTHDEDGLAQGRWTYWHDNGAKAAEGVMVDGELSGRWSVWTEDGYSHFANGGLYENGERVGD